MAESDGEDFAALFAASEGKRTRDRRVAAPSRRSTRADGAVGVLAR